MTEVPSYSIAVRALCEFTAKVGDLDLRFTPSPTALEDCRPPHRGLAAQRGLSGRGEPRRHLPHLAGQGPGRRLRSWA